MKPTGNLKRPLLVLLIVSVILAAVLGIVLVLFNTWGRFAIRVIFSAVIVAVASLCGLACDLSRTTRGLNALSGSGLVLTAIGTVLALIGMWTDIVAHEYWRATGSVSILAVATAHVCLLSIARLGRRFRWVFLIACQIIFGLAALLVVIIVWEIEIERMFRFVAVVSILDAAVTVIIPILHRISTTDPKSSPTLGVRDERSIASIDDEISHLKKRISDLEKLRDDVGRMPDRGS